MIDPHQILIGAGLFIGGMVGGMVGAVKMSLLRAHGNETSIIERSTKTGGALHISEEGLERVKEIEDRYLTEKQHIDICGKQMANIKLYIKEELEENTKTILAAIRDTR